MSTTASGPALCHADVPVPDGTVLATDYCLPAGAGPFPAVLVRTPYGRVAHHAELRAWARHGFAAVAQDVRGRHGSTGTWRPYLHEAADGAVVLRWLRSRPWSDGRVVACGTSYAAHAALATALEPPEGHVGPPDPPDPPDAVIAAVPALGLAETARERGGVERLYARAGWWAAHGDRRDSDPGALDRALAADPRLLEHLPLLDLPRRLGRPLPAWPLLWDAASADVAGRARDARTPLLAVGGTHDPFAADTVRLWRAWGVRTGAAARLLLGPWGHGLTAQPGPGARPAHRIGLGALYVRFARAALAGRLRGRRGAAGVGDSDAWLDATRFPSATAVPLNGGPWGMRTVRGAAFTADVARPVRSDRLDVPTGGVPDRCLIVSAPLPAGLHLAGSAEARIEGTADTPTADWAVRLTALTADDTAHPLAAGVARREHDGPGQTCRIRVELGPLARRLAAGTRLRVEVAGHHFPAHARNPHTGQDPVRATALRPSRRTVVTAGCRLLLPVLGASAAAARSVDPAEETTR
ncbi:peptidase S15 [Streptomyces sp. WAC 06738]|uniref:CocE/NonD family hydrolase n=1 Tax=Streptomyces sp. WAC 06738 TaxID=2203210 RepID=UPI000F701B20|nr:CocE/NonD family hydrolase [Streptomyces sp. WAC 06738]AZM49618.1 peptidase S15 [Streptomyces sp. WAC 06738]